LTRMSDEECKLAINDWFKEIEEELEFLAKRRKEVESEMTEFLHALQTNGNTSRFYPPFR